MEAIRSGFQFPPRPTTLARIGLVLGSEVKKKTEVLAVNHNSTLIPIRQREREWSGHCDGALLRMLSGVGCKLAERGWDAVGSEWLLTGFVAIHDVLRHPWRGLRSAE